MSSKSLNGAGPPPAWIIVDRYRPDQANYYRLATADGRYVPPLEQPALCCLGRVDFPDSIESGTYKIRYYVDPKNRDSEVPLSEKDEPPTVQVQQGVAVVTPAQWELVEQRREQRLERGELRNRGQAAAVLLVDQLAQTIIVLQANAIERDHAITGSIKAIAEAQAQLSQLMAAAARQNANISEAQSATMLQGAKSISEAVSQIKTDNMATVGKEIVSQVGSLAHLFMAGSRDGAPQGRLRPTERPALPPGKEPTIEKTKPNPPPGPSETRPPEGEEGWMLRLFGFAGAAGDEEKPVVQKVVSPATATAATKATETQAAEPTKATESPRSLDDDTTTETALMAPEGLGELMQAHPGLAPLFEMLGLQAPKPRAPSEGWSVKWAIREIKRRIGNLSDASIVWMTSSADNALAFLRELGELARPPAELDEATP